MKGDKLTRIRPDLIIGLIAIVYIVGVAVFEFARWLTYSQIEDKEKELVQMALEEQAARIESQYSDEAFIDAVERALPVIEERKAVRTFTTALDTYSGKAVAMKDGQPIYGKPDARYSVTVYSDIECPACRLYHPFVREFADRHSDDLYVTFSHFPLDFHGSVARDEAKAAMCAGQLKGAAAEWAVLDVLFDTSDSNGEGSPLLAHVAKGIGADETAFRQCMAAPDTESGLNGLIDAGFKARINGTPTLIFKDTDTGREFVTGAGDPEWLDARFDEFRFGRADKQEGSE